MLLLLLLLLDDDDDEEEDVELEVDEKERVEDRSAFSSWLRSRLFVVSSVLLLMSWMVRSIKNLAAITPSNGSVGMM